MLLPKPGKSSATPSNLRPITLLELSGKAAMGALASGLISQLWHFLRGYPQYAYLLQRSCNDAIARATSHCEEVRELTQLYRFRIHQSAAGMERPALYGGVLISLDLTKAFDSVHRVKIYEALEHFAVEPSFITFLQQIYQDTSFTLVHRGQKRTIPTFKGIRQGCKAAPCLWAIIVAFVMDQLSALTTRQWIDETNTVYADDWIVSSTFHSPGELSLLLRRIGYLLDVLADMGLQINEKKTMAVLKMQGAKLQQLQKQFVRRTLEGVFLRVPRRGGQETLIQITAQQPYLGTVLSYSRFEAQTAEFRINQATRVSHLLNKWLMGRTGLTMKHKFNVCCMCAAETLQEPGAH